MAHTNRLRKVALFDDPHMNLVGSVIVGQSADTIIVERPAAKPRVKPAAPRKPRTPKAKAPAVTLPTSEVA